MVQNESFSAKPICGASLQSRCCTIGRLASYRGSGLTQLTLGRQAARGRARRDLDNLPLWPAGVVRSTGGRFVRGLFQKRKGVLYTTHKRAHTHHGNHKVTGKPRPDSKEAYGTSAPSAVRAVIVHSHRRCASPTGKTCTSANARKCARGYPVTIVPGGVQVARWQRHIVHLVELISTYRRKKVLIGLPRAGKRSNVRVCDDLGGQREGFVGFL
jgi:hypothetical protein